MCDGWTRTLLDMHLAWLVLNWRSFGWLRRFGGDRDGFALDEVEGLENKGVIAPVTDTLVDSIVRDADAILVEEAVEGVDDLEDLFGFSGGDMNQKRILEARLETALGTLDDEAGKQGSDSCANAGVFQRIESVATGRGADKEGEMANLPRIADARGGILQRVALKSLAIHEVDAPGSEVIQGVLLVSPADLKRSGLIGWESPAWLRMCFIGGKPDDAERSDFQPR